VNYDALNQSIARVAPILLFLSLALVISGTVILLFFGYTIYELLVTPEKSVFLNYILSQLPAPSDPTYSIKGIIDNKNFEFSMPSNILAYGRYILAFMIWAMIGGLVTSLISGGMNIFKVLTNLSKNEKSNQKDNRNADTRDSHNTR
jgi:hypothetical protein